MQTLEFQPTKILLLFWLLGAFLVCLPIGVFIAVACTEADIPVATVTLLASFIILILLEGYLVLYFFSIRYVLDDRYVTRASGVLWKKRRSIPLEKITTFMACGG